MSKICMLVTNSVKKDPRVQKEAISAYNNGHQVTVVGISDSNRDDDFIEKAPYNIVLIDSIKNQRKRFSFSWFVVGLLKTLRYNQCFERIVEEIQPDIVHANDYDTLVAGYKSAKKCGAKLVYDSHEVATGSILADKYPIVKSYIRMREGYIIRRADHVISVSNAAADYLKELYDIKRPTVITNCPNLWTNTTTRAIDDKFDVLYQGIMSYGRGYEAFVESAALAYEGITYTLRGYGEIKQHLIELAKDNGLNHVMFAEPVEISELITAAAQSSVGVVLTESVCVNYDLTVSNKIFEYIQAELPVIMSPVPEHRYLNEKYHFGIVIDSVSPEAIATAINELFTNRIEYERLRTNVIAAKRELCWEKFEEILLEVYK